MHTTNVRELKKNPSLALRLAAPRVARRAAGPVPIDAVGAIVTIDSLSALGKVAAVAGVTAGSSGPAHPRPCLVWIPRTSVSAPKKKTMVLSMKVSPGCPGSELLENDLVTPEDRALIDRAVATVGTDLTAFVVSSVTTAARRVLADRTEFIMSPKVAKVWEAINKRRARDLPGLRKLLKRGSPFATE